MREMEGSAIRWQSQDSKPGLLAALSTPLVPSQLCTVYPTFCRTMSVNNVTDSNVHFLVLSSPNDKRDHTTVSSDSVKTNLTVGKKVLYFLEVQGVIRTLMTSSSTYCEEWYQRGIPANPVFVHCWKKGREKKVKNTQEVRAAPVGG